jgi:hypothetical protein
MTTRSRGALAGFGWLRRAVHLGHRNARAVFGGAAFVVLMSLLPSLITLPMQWGTMRSGATPDTTTMVAIMVISIVGSLLLVPLIAGYLRVIDAAEQGRPARARDVFALYRQGEVLRLMGYGLAMLVVYIAAIAIVLAVAGGGIGQWYLQALGTQAGSPPPALPGMPPHLGIAIALFAVLLLLIMGIYAISLGQVALGGRSVAGALADGVVGSLKNLLPLLVFAVSITVAWIVVVIALVLVVGAVALLGKLVGVWLTIVLAVPLYIALMLTAFVVMFGAIYHLWRDVCGDDAAPAGTAQSIAA